MFAVLEVFDFVIIWLIITVFAGGTAVYGRFHRGHATRLRRIEEKLDVILKHLNLEYKPSETPGELSEKVKALADDPARKIEAIKVHREETGADLKEAKDAIEAYIEGRDRKPPAGNPS